MTKCIIHSNISLCEGGDTLVEKTIKEIRETEQKAEEMISNAKMQSAQILENAKQEAVTLKSGMIGEAQEKAERARSAAQHAGGERLEAALKAADKEIAELRQTAKSKEEEAVHLIIQNLI